MKTAGETYPLFALGFRPFYLLAGLYAAFSVPIWGLQYAGWLPGMDPLWHAHEMLFGYVFAVITGFLFTAVRNWTGLPTPAGRPLAAIAGLWVVARVLACHWPEAGAYADALFAVSVAWGLGRPILASRNRNWFFVVLVLALGAASIGFHAAPRLALSVGLDLVLFVIAVIAGRVVPMFTNNAVPGAGARRNRALEISALGSILLLLVLDVMEPQAAAAYVSLAAAILHGIRVSLWAPFKARSRPILWILHLSYAWISVHLMLRFLAGMGFLSPVLATHALTVGAIGGITIGMMTRTARGHTGRPLVAGLAEISAYLLVQAAAVVRVFLPLILPAAYVASVVASAVLWGTGFAIFCITYYPILSRRRLDGQAG